MFQGTTQLNLDGKGRLAIPARYRDMLLGACAGNLVLTVDPEGCLLVYPAPEWNPIREKLNNLSSFNRRSRMLQQLLVGNAEDVVMDSAGRVLIPPLLRTFAALDKSVMLVGQGKKFELWDEGKWQTQQQAALQLLQQMNGDLPPELEGFSL